MNIEKSSNSVNTTNINNGVGNISDMINTDNFCDSCCASNIIMKSSGSSNNSNTSDNSGNNIGKGLDTSDGVSLGANPAKGNADSFFLQ